MSEFRELLNEQLKEPEFEKEWMRYSLKWMLFVQW